MPDPKWDTEKGTVTLVKGDQMRTLDLNKEEDRTALMKGYQRGWHFDDEASVELGQLRTVVKNWDSTLEAAKTSEEGREQLIKKLETAGVKLTAAEKKEIKKEDPKILFDEDENSALIKTLSSLNKRLDEIEKSQQDFKKNSDDKETEAEIERLNKEADALEKKFNGKDKDGKDNGTPKFERDNVFKFMAKNSISDPELAFKMMNYDKLTEIAQKKAIDEFKEQQKERHKVNILKGDESTNDLGIPQKEKAKSYHQLGQKALKSINEKGLNLFTDG